MKRYLLVVLLFVSIVFANDCNNKLFSFKNSENSSVTLYSLLNALVVDSCNLNIVYKDDVAKSKVAQLTLNKLSVKDYTLRQLLDLLISGNNLFYKLNDNKLEISYIQTKTFNIDYIISTRTGSATFTASSSENTGDTNSVDASYEFNFWGTLSKQLNNILNTVDTYKVRKPIIDKNAGLVTITATKRQLDRVKAYIDKLNKRLHKQIIIDVKIYSVDLAKANQTGINWGTLSFSIGAPKTPVSVPVNSASLFGSQSVFSSALFNIDGLVNFLATQGNVNSISNPKIATLNNQKSIISVGDTINYRYPTKVVIDTNGNPQTEYTIGNKFVGILLDITPEIGDDDSIMLRINPTISSFRDETQLTDPNRQLAPDTTDKKLSTVVRIKDGQTLILGGLITNINTFSENGVPVLKEIPVIKYLFSSKSKISTRRELVFVVTPHIVDLNKKRTIQDLGF